MKVSQDSHKQYSSPCSGVLASKHMFFTGWFVFLQCFGQYFHSSWPWYGLPRENNDTYGAYGYQHRLLHRRDSWREKCGESILTIFWSIWEIAVFCRTGYAYEIVFKQPWKVSRFREPRGCFPALAWFKICSKWGCLNGPGWPGNFGPGNFARRNKKRAFFPVSVFFRYWFFSLSSRKHKKIIPFEAFPSKFDP